MAQEITELTGDIQGENMVCTGEVVFFTVDAVENATHYIWETGSQATVIAGIGTNEVEVLIESEGSFDICVKAENGCYQGTQSCMTITSDGLADVDTLFESFCNGDSIEFEGNIYNESGFYSTIYTNVGGCDSVLSLDLLVYPDYFLTVHETFSQSGGFYNGIFYNTDTSIIEEYSTIHGCDSIVIVNIGIGGQCPLFEPPNGCGLTIPCCNGIDGYSTTLQPQAQITKPIPDCGGTAVLNNDDWFSFVAVTETISIKITPFNCAGTGGTMGIQAGIYKDCDAEGGINSDGLASNSIQVSCGCTTAPINLTYSNYIIGELYFLVIDGCSGDICDYEIEVLEGSTVSPEITEMTSDIQGNETACIGETVFFSVDPVENASYYFCQIEPQATIISGQGTNEIEVLVEEEGNIDVCVDPSNACYYADQSCLTFTSAGEVYMDTLFESFCMSDSIEFEGEYYTENGFYSAVYTNIYGCDSILNLDLTVFENY